MFNLAVAAVAAVGALIAVFAALSFFVRARNSCQKKGALSTKALRNEDDETRPPIQTPEQGPGFDNVNIDASSTSQTRGSSIGHESEPVRDGDVLLDVGNDDPPSDAQPMVADEPNAALTAIESEQREAAVIMQEAPITPSDEGRKAATEHTPGFLERFLPTFPSCRPCAPCGQAAPVEATITSL